MLDDSVRPKLRLDAKFLPTTEGVLFRSRGRIFTLKGTGIYDLMSRLAPHLSGALTVREICGQLNPAAQEVVKKLLEALVVRQVVINRITEHSSLPEAVRSEFSAQIEFIEHFADRPQYRFSRLREASVFVTGAGAALSSMCISLVRNGFRSITLDRDVTSYEKEQSFAREVDGLRAAGIEVTIAHSSLSAESDNLTGDPSVICYASAEPNFASLFRLNEYSLQHDILFVPGYVLDGLAVIGPIVKRQTGCFTCSLLRRARHMSADLEAELWRGIALSRPWIRDLQPASYPSLRILGNLVAFEAFKALLGQVAHDSYRAITSVDLETLETRAAQLIADPTCPHCRSLTPQRDSWVVEHSSDLEIPPSLTHEEQILRLEPAVNPEYGLVHSFDDDALIQTPLFRSTLVVRKGNRNETEEIDGYSIISNAAARIAAFLEGAKKSTVEMSDTTSLGIEAVSDSQSLPFPRVNPTRLAHTLRNVALRCAEPVQWMPAQSAIHHTFHSVPVAAVFPNSTLNLGLFETLSGGIGAAFSPQDASREAIASLITCEALKRVSRREMTLHKVNTAALAQSNPDVQYLISACGHLGTTVCMCGIDLADYGSLVLAASHTNTDPEHIAVGFGLNAGEAATRTLTDLLALSLNGKPRHILSRLLPPKLGYDLDYISVPLLANPTGDVELPAERKTSVWFDDILICDVTAPDLSRCGVTVCKALMVASM